MDFKAATFFILLLLAINFDNEVSCSVRVVITESDSGEVDDATANQATGQVIKFPILEIFNSGKKHTGVKVINHANTGFTRESDKFRSPYNDGMFRYETIPDEPSVQSQESEFLPARSVPDYLSNSIDAEPQDPPPYNETARMTRYIVANSSKIF